MTEYEGVALFIEFVNISIQIVLAYVSVLSAFLVMSYFAAGKLHPWLIIIVIVLFTLVCLLLLAQLTFVRNDMGQLYQYLVAQSSDGTIDVPWLGTNPAWGIKVLTILHVLVTIGGYIGCIAFFVYQRRGSS
jgi:hypothetical protein